MSTHNIQFHDQNKKTKIPNYLFSCAIGRILYGLKNEFESSRVNEPSGFESLRLYCIYFQFKDQTCFFMHLHSPGPEGGVENRGRSSRFSTSSKGPGECQCIENLCSIAFIALKLKTFATFRVMSCTILFRIFTRVSQTQFQPTMLVFRQ